MWLCRKSGALHLVLNKYPSRADTLRASILHIGCKLMAAPLLVATLAKKKMYPPCHHVCSGNMKLVDISPVWWYIVYYRTSSSSLLRWCIHWPYPRNQRQWLLDTMSLSKYQDVRSCVIDHSKFQVDLGRADSGCLPNLYLLQYWCEHDRYWKTWKEYFSDNWACLKGLFYNDVFWDSCLCNFFFF